MGYSHLQSSHIQQQPHHQSQVHGALPPPNLNNPGFGPGSAASNSSPFAMAGGMSNGGFPDAGLSSHAAQMSFARGGQVQTQAIRDLERMEAARRINNGESRIRNVWAHNLKQEMKALRALVGKYPYIAMARPSIFVDESDAYYNPLQDTEFPGIVARPMGPFTTKIDYHYQTLRCNVDLLKMIQLGISLFAHDGELPPANYPSSSQNSNAHLQNMLPAPYTWQFNFKFSLATDMYAEESTNLLTKAGIDFSCHEKQGINPHDFGALLISSGLVLDADVHWLSFHSGYDFGYLVKLMICKPLPQSQTDYYELLNAFFPSLYDIKFLLTHAGRKGTINDEQPLTPEAQAALQKIASKGGLADIAEELNVNRIGVAHQAGSDSLLTGQVFFKTREKVFNGHINPKQYSGQVWGLNAQLPPPTRDLNTPNMNGAIFYSQNGAPSTPQTTAAGLAQGQTHTPIPGPGIGGHMTPGGGNFGNFTYGKGMS